METIRIHIRLFDKYMKQYLPLDLSTAYGNGEAFYLRQDKKLSMSQLNGYTIDVHTLSQSILKGLL